MQTTVPVVLEVIDTEGDPCQAVRGAPRSAEPSLAQDIGRGNVAGRTP